MSDHNTTLWAFIVASYLTQGKSSNPLQGLTRSIHQNLPTFEPTTLLQLSLYFSRAPLLEQQAVFYLGALVLTPAVSPAKHIASYFDYIRSLLKRHFSSQVLLTNSFVLQPLLFSPK